MSIADNIRRIRKAHNLSQEDFGKIAGVSSMAVSQWENNRAVPRMGAVQRIADYFNISKGEVIDEESDVAKYPPPPNAIPVRGTSAMVPVRVLGSTHAGERMDELESDYDVEFPEGVVERHPGCFALKVEGDCMDRRYPNGCMVLVDPAMEPRNGHAVVAEFDDGRSLLRTYMRGSSTLMLTADSFSEYEDIIVTPDDPPVRTVGVVVWYQSSEEVD